METNPNQYYCIFTVLDSTNFGPCVHRCEIQPAPSCVGQQILEIFEQEKKHCFGNERGTTHFRNGTHSTLEYTTFLIMDNHQQIVFFSICSAHRQGPFATLGIYFSSCVYIFVCFLYCRGLTADAADLGIDNSSVNKLRNCMDKRGPKGCQPTRKLFQNHALERLEFSFFFTLRFSLNL